MNENNIQATITLTLTREQLMALLTSAPNVQTAVQMPEPVQVAPLPQMPVQTPPMPEMPPQMPTQQTPPQMPALQDAVSNSEGNDAVSDGAENDSEAAGENWFWTLIRTITRFFRSLFGRE